MCLRSKLIAIVSLSLFTHFAFAEEHGGGGAAAAPPAQGEGGGEASSAHIKNPEWMDLNTDLLVLKAKINNKKEIIEKLIEEKEHTKDPVEAGKLIKEMVTEHKELQKTIQVYEEKRNLLKYRFPEAGLQKEREYERIEGQSLEQIEIQMGVSGKIKSNLEKVKSKFGMQTKSKKELERERAINNPKVDPNNLANPIILSK